MEALIRILEQVRERYVSYLFRPKISQVRERLKEKESRGEDEKAFNYLINIFLGWKKSV